MLADALNPLYEQITQDGFIAAFEIYAMLLNKFVNPILISILGIAAVASILISLFNGIAVQAMMECALFSGH
ncbi:hypothetical protein OAT97_00015 [Gammaproteobacteria bacterium]|nr:hypothetical protein [Gammaproteobacteria bacterium]